MKIAFDTEEMKPGCVLLQATMGCDSAMAHLFSTAHWLLAPTPNLKVYEVNDSQLDQLVEMVEAVHGTKLR